MSRNNSHRTSGLLTGRGIISDFQKKIIRQIKKLPDFSYFYLTGGTALAEFYLGHRRSYDLDIFTPEKELVLPFSRAAEDQLRKNKICVKVIRRFSSFVEFEVSLKNEITKIHLACDSPFKFEKPAESDLGINVNSYKDIVVDKLLAFFGRTEPRDAIDLFFILKKENIWQITKLAVQKDPGFDLYWLAVALQKVKDFPDEIVRWPVEMLMDIKIKDLKDTFLSLSQEIIRRLKK